MNIELINFSKSYGALKAVEDVSLSILQRKITCLLGENGAGKTTILKSICAVQYPSSGKILVNGIDTYENPVAVKECIGFVAEQPSLYPSFTVKEFLRFIAEMRCNKNEIRASIERTVSTCSIESVMNKTINTLSKGYRQRVSFACALINNPKIIILDEPTSGLDPIQISQIRDLIKTLSSTTTILFSTHLMQEVESLAEIIAIISKGHLLFSGTKQELLKKTNSDTLEESFLSITGHKGNN